MSPCARVSLPSTTLLDEDSPGRPCALRVRVPTINLKTGLALSFLGSWAACAPGWACARRTWAPSAGEGSQGSVDGEGLTCSDAGAAFVGPPHPSCPFLRSWVVGQFQAGCKGVTISSPERETKGEKEREHVSSSV